MRDSTIYLQDINTMSMLMTNLSGKLQAKGNRVRNLCDQGSVMATLSGAFVIRSHTW